MKLPPSAAAALGLSLLATAAAQMPLPDPANLRGERVAPSTGRELPLDLPEAQGGRGLQQMLRRLSTRASLMLIVAHPDDEDGGMLTALSRGLGARVCNLTLNRGEGGQNAVTGDFEDALGLIRTQELLSADRYLGADQMFGTEVDFGFSKTKAESFSKWGHQRVLYDAVRAVRLYRPLVIASVFIGGVTDGHGQHQVSGEIAQEVFKAAGDPTVFPELTREGILPWQPLKVYARVPSFAITPRGLFDYATDQYVPPTFTNYVTGAVSTTPPSVDITVHEGQLDPLLTDAAAAREDLPDPKANPDTELSYVQFARIGLGLQKTQIGPTVRMAPAGVLDVGYHLYGSRLCGAPAQAVPPRTGMRACVAPIPASDSGSLATANFFDGIDTRLQGIATLAPGADSAFAGRLTTALAGIAASIARAQASFSPRSPANAAPPLVDALRSTEQLLATVEATGSDQLPPSQRADLLHELRVKRVQLNEALVDALGLQLTAAAPAPDLLVGTPVRVPARLSLAAGDAAVDDLALADRTSLALAPPSPPKADRTLAPGRPLTQTLTLSSWQSTTLTQPYFFRTDPEQPVYQLRDPALRNAPQTPPALVAWGSVSYRGVAVRLGRVVDSAGQPISFVPPLSIALRPTVEVVPRGNPPAPLRFTALAESNLPAAEALVTLGMPNSWKLLQPLAAPRLRTPGATADIPASVLPVGLAQPQEAENSVLVKAYVQQKGAPGGSGTDLGYRAVGYPGIPFTNLYVPAQARVASFALRLPVHRRIGYLPGTGDAVPQALAAVGLPVTLLTVADLTPERLAQFDTVMLGVRTYNAHPELHGEPTMALLDFARRGGNVVVQYQTGEFTAADAPYPLTLGFAAAKVVDETAPVQLVDPRARVLNVPNRLTEADFGGWIEERGHGFPGSWDPRYSAPTETHDPGAPAEHIQPQAPQRGGLLTTTLGRGHWSYCAFALYRQLPQAVPGAYRLMSNLLALADAP